MKHATACLRCRDIKRRCDQAPNDEAGSACIPCAKKGLPCSLTKPTKDAKQLRVLNERPKIELKSALVANLAKLYLHFIHGRPHSLFNARPLLQEIVEPGFNQPLKLLICSMGCKFADEETVRRLSDDLMRDGERVLNASISRSCVEHVQALVLLANLCAAESLVSEEALYFGIATRMAQILGLHKVDCTDSPAIRETKHRIWWTLYMADRWCSSGLGIPRLISVDAFSVEERTGASHAQSVSGLLEGSAMDGLQQYESQLWAQMIVLAEVFGRIQDMNRCIVANSLHDDVIMHQVRGLDDELHHWQAQLPANMHHNKNNLERFRQLELGGCFVALHLGFHHYATLLYFQFLNSEWPPQPSSTRWLEKCKYHAFAYSNLLHESRTTPGCEAVYPTVAHMALVSSAVLLHTLSFGEESELATARQCLSNNFQAIDELKTYWPSVKSTINRLFTFQNACLQSAEPGVHKIDRWMIRFLIEHALPLGGDPPELAAASTPTDTSYEVFSLHERGKATRPMLLGLLG